MLQQGNGSVELIPSEKEGGSETINLRWKEYEFDSFDGRGRSQDIWELSNN